MATANITDPFVWGKGGRRLTPEQIAAQRVVEDALMARGLDFSPVGHPLQGLARVADAFTGAVRRGQLDSAAEQNAATSQSVGRSLLGAMFGASERYPDTPAPPVTSAPENPNLPSRLDFAKTGQSGDLRAGILNTAQSLGIDPVDLATAISYETAGTFDPAKRGPTTQWGQHRGLIQFGEPQAAKYGVDWNNPLGSQLGPDGAVAKYLRDTGVQPGMGMLDIYSAINAGRVGRYNASDANNGGAPGTVADKVNSQMAGHRRKAMALLGDLSGQQPTQVASLDPGIGLPAQAPVPSAPPQMAGLSVGEGAITPIPDRALSTQPIGPASALDAELGRRLITADTRCVLRRF